jgi:hypothetical protein
LPCLKAKPDAAVEEERRPGAHNTGDGVFPDGVRCVEQIFRGHEDLAGHDIRQRDRPPKAQIYHEKTVQLTVVAVILKLIADETALQGRIDEPRVEVLDSERIGIFWYLRHPLPLQGRIGRELQHLR